MQNFMMKQGFINSSMTAEEIEQFLNEGLAGNIQQEADPAAEFSTSVGDTATKGATEPSKKGKKGLDNKEKSAEERADDYIREAERSRAHMYEIEGRNKTGNSLVLQHIDKPVQSITMIDNDYQMIDSHLDESLKRKIVSYEYVDFGKLIRGKSRDDDNWLEFVTRNGSIYLTPVSDKDGVQITSYIKWEQAFRIFSNVLTTRFPDKSTELLQYNHTIPTALMAYQWDNVYAYDKEFRHHIARHPNRTWNVLLQQTWTMILKDRLHQEGGPFQRNKYSKHDAEPCRRFNRGRCTFGLSCKFDHRCSVKKCGKFGHGAFQCRLRNDSDKNQDKPLDAKDSDVATKK